MKSLNTIQTLSKIGKVLSKIVFILSVIGVCGCFAGVVSLSMGNGSLFKIGGVSLHGMVTQKQGESIQGLAAALAGWMIVCAGKAVLAKFAEVYFKNELTAGTPFTYDGAKELLRLGILAIALPLGCAVAGSIVEGIIAGFLDVEKATALEVSFNNESSIMLGISFIVISLICKYGAEVIERGEKF